MRLLLALSLAALCITHRPGPIAAQPAAVATPAPAATAQPSPYRPAAESLNPLAANRRASDRAAAAMAQPADFELKETTLPKFAALLEAKLNMPVRINAKSLQDAGIDPDETKITFPRTAISTRSALDLILREHDLTWVVEYEVISITTPDRATTCLETRCYDLSETDSHGEPIFDDDEALIDAITSQIAPQTWDGVGGTGSIKEFHAGEIDVLIISQRREVHEFVEDFFAQLRSMRRPPMKTGSAKPRRRAKRQDDEELVAEKAPLPSDANRDAVVAADNEFAFDLFRKLSDETDQNAIYSPHSVATALAMVKAGADSSTADELNAALNWKGTDEQLHAGHAALRSALQTNPNTDLKINGKPTGPTLHIANRLWAQKLGTPKQPFLDTLRTNYAAELGLVDFIKQPDDVVRDVNTWVATQTADRIRDLISRDNITANTRSILVNAIYFKADWAKPFDISATRFKPFETPAGSKQVSMMAQQEKYPYAQLDDCQAISLGYNTGKSAVSPAMLILLPPRGDESPDAPLAALEKSLSAERFNHIVSQLRLREVDLELPKFKIEASYAVHPSLAELGVKKAFDSSAADFTNMFDASEQFFVEQIIHRALIEVDEKGTVAAAATAVFGGGGGFESSPRPVKFHADHPFLLVIYDTRTNAILFIARITNPLGDA